MFDLGWTELLVIGIVALIVIGPKDLPGMFHTLGKVMAKVRAMGRDFSRAMNDAAQESGMSDVTKDLRNIANPKKMGLDAVKDAATKFESWDPMKTGAKPASERGPHTQALSKERAEAAEKIRKAAAEKAQARIDAEKAAEAAKVSEAAADAAPKPAPKKSAAKTTAAKKPAAKKAPAKKPAAKKAPAKKPAAKKTPAKKADE